MLQKFCGVPKAEVAVCTNLSWGKDFSDPQSMIDPLFNGNSIIPTGNVNTAQVDDPSVNRKLAADASITDPDRRAQAPGQLDRS